MRKPPLPRFAAARYTRAVRALMTSWSEYVLAHPRATYADLTGAWTRLTLPEHWLGIFRAIAIEAENEIIRYYRSVLRRQPPPVRVQRQAWIDQQMALLADIGRDQIDRLQKLPRRDARTDARELAAVRAARKANVALITRTTPAQQTRLIDLLRQAQPAGVRHESLAASVRDVLDIGLTRAKLIARDQTVKHNAAVNEAQARAAGAIEYTWRDSGDGSVRPMHHALSGRRFRYDDPPVTNEDGDRNNPGEDYNCRCQAEPVLPGAPGAGESLFAGLEEPVFTGLGFGG